MYIRLFYLLLILAVFRPVTADDYYSYYPDFSIPVMDGAGDTLPNAYAGGLLKPRVSNIDLNHNGILDLLLFDREDERILTFINEGTPGNPSFRYDPSYEEKIPDVRRFVITRDYNHNGKMDIFTYGTPGNAGFRVYENVSSGNELAFSLASERLQRRGGTYINTSQEDIPGIGDVSGDGAIDILIFGVFGGFVQYFENVSFSEYGHYDSLHYDKIDECWGRFFEHTGDTAQYQLGVYYDWCRRDFEGLSQMRHAGGAVMPIDYNQSGATDLLISDVDASHLSLLINGKNDTSPSYPVDTMVNVIDNFPPDHPVDIKYKPAPYYVDVDNSGVNDLIVAPANFTPVDPVNQIWYYRNEGANDNPDFKFVQDDFIQESMIDEGAYNTPLFFDVNGNGLEDLVITVNRGLGAFEYESPRLIRYENVGSDSVPAFQKQDDDYLGFSDKHIKGLHPAFGDLTGNGAPDMLAGTAEGPLRFYENSSNSDSINSIQLIDENYQEIDAGEYTTPFLFDYNENGLPDLFIGNKQGTIHYYENQGTAEEPDFVFVTDSMGKIWTAESYVTSGQTYYMDGFSAPVVADINRDNTFEIITGSRNRGVMVFGNNANDPEAAFQQIEHLFLNYDQNMNRKLHSRNIKPAVSVLKKDSLPFIFAGTARGGILSYGASSEGIERMTLNVIEQQHVSCADSADGMIRVEALGGQAPYDYTWAHGASGTETTGLSGDEYTLTVTDQNNFQLNETFIINEPDPLEAGFDSEPVTGDCDGMISVLVSGGTPPYQLTWEAGDTLFAADTNVIGELCDGEYRLSVTDANGCFYTETVTPDYSALPENISNQAIKMYPNPAGNMLNLEGDGMQFVNRIDILDVSGRNVLSESTESDQYHREIDISDLDEGVYLVRIYSEGGPDELKIKRLVKE